ncbi:MAG: hypothetical protein ACRC5V_04665 [Aeromonas sp.]
MQSFNWIDIDGIRYSWDGHGNITCAGQFGYRASFAGDRLEWIELENEAGDIAGSLYVDFASASISYLPVINTELTHNMMLVGNDQGQEEYPLIYFHSLQLDDLVGQCDTITWSEIELLPKYANHEPSSQGVVLSWDSFYFDDELGVCDVVSPQDIVGIRSACDSTITINLDVTNQILDQIPPLHEI